MPALLFLVACGPVAAPPPVQPAPEAAASATPTWRDLLGRLDAQIATAERLAEEHPDDWSRLATVGDLYAERGRLTGSFDDYGEASSALDRALAEAPPGSGPLLSRARLDYSLHRLDRVGSSLDLFERRILIDDNQRSEVLSIRADLAFQTGDMAGAEALYAQSLALHPALPAAYGLAQLAWRRGHPEEALADLDACEELVKGTSALSRLFIDVQRGIVQADRGRYEQALGHYRDAEAHVAGHWLVQEQVADANVRLGRLDEALAIYQASSPVSFRDPATGEVVYSYTIARETGNPTFLDGIARIYRARGDEAAAAQWAAKAEALTVSERTAWPESAAGHALQHALSFGTDPAATVAMAERNAAIRPNGEALTLLATAYRQSGDLDTAADAVRRALATGWNTPATHAEAARIEAAAGDAAGAEREWTLATTLNASIRDIPDAR